MEWNGIESLVVVLQLIRARQKVYLVSDIEINIGMYWLREVGR